MFVSGYLIQQAKRLTAIKGKMLVLDWENTQITHRSTDNVYIRFIDYISYRVLFTQMGNLILMAWQIYDM